MKLLIECIIALTKLLWGPQASLQRHICRYSARWTPNIVIQADLYLFNTRQLIDSLGCAVKLLEMR